MHTQIHYNITMMQYLSTYKSIRYNITTGEIGYIHNAIVVILVVIGVYFVLHDESYIVKTQYGGTVSVINKFTPNMTYVPSYCDSNYTGHTINNHKLKGIFECKDPDHNMHLIKNSDVLELETSIVDDSYNVFVRNVEDTLFFILSSE